MAIILEFGRLLSSMTPLFISPSLLCFLSHPFFIVGEDYISSSVGLELNGLQRTACYDITILENDKPQHMREFKVQLEASAQAHSLRLEPDHVTVTILDDDGENSSPT